jgi:N-acetylglucosaminyldiphosphoundecaprenol N-acetyl-beta-D-mannosaminyltransferase
MTIKRILTQRVDTAPKEILKSQALKSQAEGNFVQVVTINAEMCLQANRDPHLSRIIDEAGVVIPDGSGIVIAARHVFKQKLAKIAGISFTEELLAHAAAHNLTVYFVGGKPGVAQRAALALQAKYPGLRFVGVRDGYFKSNEESQLLQHIQQTQPDILCVALGVPRQEKWIYQYREQLKGILCLGVGGSFDVFSGDLKRAPQLFQTLHLEWLYRLLQEPWRLGRMLSALPYFMYLVFKTPIVDHQQKNTPKTDYNLNRP